VPRRSARARRLVRAGLALATVPGARRHSAVDAIAAAPRRPRRTFGSPWLPALSLDHRQAGGLGTGSAPGCSREARRLRAIGPNDPLLSPETEASEARSGVPPPSVESRRIRRPTLAASPLPRGPEGPCGTGLAAASCAGRPKASVAVSDSAGSRTVAEAALLTVTGRWRKTPRLQSLSPLESPYPIRELVFPRRADALLGFGLSRAFSLSAMGRASPSLPF
jgi:hypothetical protein